MASDGQHHKDGGGEADLRLVTQAAGLVELSEYEVFALAYRRWYGAAASRAALEAAFGPYLRGAGAPAWVRHTARAICAGEPAALAAVAARRGTRLEAEAPPRHRWWALAATAAAMALALWMVARPPSYIDPGPESAAAARPLACQGGGPGLELFEQVAHALAGKAPPACDRP